MDPTHSFTRSVCAAPDDDVPRLVYADWLDEHGDPDRAAFIRLQCELATLAGDSPRRREVAFLARQLEDRHGDGWAPPEAHDRRFARGFVEMLGVTAGDLDEHGPMLFGLNPVRRLQVSGMGGDVRPLRRSVPRENAVTALELTGNDLTAGSLRQLAGFAPLAGVRELGLLFNRLDDEAAQVLCGEAFFQRMPLIRCGANPMTDAGRRRLRDHFGDRVTFTAERDSGHLYTFQDDGDRFTVGYGSGYTQLLMYGWFDTRYLAVFDHTGRLLRTETRLVPEGTGTLWERAEQADSHEKAWLAELGHELATIRVQRFAFPDGSGVRDYPEDMIESLDLDEWGYWLEDGKFRYDYGDDDCWLNGSGEVTDT